MMDYLLVEHKERCWDCDLMRIEEMHEIAFCGRTGGKVMIDGKPEWCPLHPLPAKMDKPRKDKGNYERGYWYGWNACIDEITGGNDETQRHD